MQTLKVMVVDDSILYRKIISDVLLCFPGVEIAATANSGNQALEKLKTCSVDLVTLDFEMPGLNGLETLTEIKKLYPGINVVMLSTKTVEGATVTLKALEIGAFDYIAKPDQSSIQKSMAYLKKQIGELLAAVSKVNTFSGTAAVKKESEESRPSLQPAPFKISHTARRCAKRVEVVAIAVSTGGPNSLIQVIPKLPHDLRVPVVLVQHMPATFTSVLARTLDEKSDIKVVEAEDNMRLEKGTVYIAPGGKQMKIADAGGLKRIVITDDDSVNNCKPAADYTFESLAENYKGSVLGVIMTGMGGDGARSLKKLHDAGCKVIAQNAETCVVYGMPKEAVRLGAVDVEVPLEAIADEIINSL